MLLTRAVIQHYKSLDNVDVRFSDLTVLVGPNGVGKSNFVDSLRFLRDAMRDGLEHAVIAREGFERIRQNGESDHDVDLSLEFQISRDSELTSDYHLTLSEAGGECQVSSESSNFLAEELEWDEHGDAHVINYSPASFERGRRGEIRIDDDIFERAVLTGSLAIGTFIGDFLGGAIEPFTRRWSFCALYPNTLRKLSPLAKENGLLEDGSNWASVVRALKRTPDGLRSLERIAEVMRIAVPGYKDISVSIAGSYLVPQITLSSEVDCIERTQEFDPVQLSDGTLRVFGILLALYQEPPPAFLVIEEPEQTVHPGVLPALAEAFKEASERTQIIITTHSPQLVDQFPPECIRVVSSVGGLTRISPIKASQVEAVKQRLMSLQEFMSAEGLLPEDEAS